MVSRQARLDQRRACHVRGRRAARSLPAILFALLAGRIARVARGLALGLERHFPGGGLFLFACQLCRGLRRLLGLAGYLLGLGGLARQPGLGPLGRLRLALGLPLSDRGIVETRLARNLFRMFCLASCAAFCRSAKLGSLNPLIERALSLSLFGVRRSVCGSRQRRAGAFSRSGAVYSRAGPEAIN